MLTNLLKKLFLRHHGHYHEAT